MSNAQPDGPLSGRTALVTGAASGIGAAVARRMAADGAAVLAVDRDAEGIKALARDVPGVEPVTCDLSDLDAVDALPAQVDVLVNNAGLQHVAPVHEFDPERFSLILTIMLEAPFRMARRMLPHMYERGWGRVINISSVHGLRASPFKSAYVTAKHGLEGLSKVIALEGARARASPATASTRPTCGPRWSRSRSPTRPASTGSARTRSSRRSCWRRWR